MSNSKPNLNLSKLIKKARNQFEAKPNLGIGGRLHWAFKVMWANVVDTKVVCGHHCILVDSNHSMQCL